MIAKIKKIKSSHLLIGASIAGLVAYGGYKYLEYLESKKLHYDDETLIKVSKQIFKNVFPSLNKLYKISARNAKIYNQAQNPNERNEIILSFQKDKEIFNSELVQAVLLAYEKFKIDPVKYLETFDRRKNVNPELKKLEDRLQKYVETATKGMSLLQIDEASMTIPTQKLKEIYHDAIIKTCNEILDRSEEFIKEKAEKKEEWQMEELKTELNLLNNEKTNNNLEEEIKGVEGILNEDDHHDLIFQSSLIKSVKENDEGIVLFLDQCDFTKKTVLGTLSDFRPDLVM